MKALTPGWRPALAIAAAVGLALGVTACSDPSTQSSSEETDAPTREAQIASLIDSVQFDQALHDSLPASVLDAGQLSVATFSGQPPWVIPNSDPTQFTGVTADLSDAFEKLLGIPLQRNALGTLADIKTGIQAERYDFAMGPVGDDVTSQKTMDFIDWVREHVVFAVPAGNPLGIETLDDTCGVKMAVIAGGSAEKVLEEQATKCTAAGEAVPEVLPFSAQPDAILAVQSGRADAYFSSQALLEYYAQQDGSGLEITGTTEDNGFPDFYQGAVFPKESALTPVMLKAFQSLESSGVYSGILEAWGQPNAVVDRIGENLRTY